MNSEQWLRTMYLYSINNNNNNNNKAQIQELRHRDRTNVEPEMYDHTSNNWSHWYSNTELKEKSASYTRNTSNRLFTKDGYTWNITQTTESTTV